MNDGRFIIPSQQEAEDFSEAYLSLARISQEVRDELAERKRLKRNFEARFQRWCDKNFERQGTRLGKRGMSIICDYCDCNHDKGKTCVRALNALLTEKKITLDYSHADPKTIWIDPARGGGAG